MCGIFGFIAASNREKELSQRDLKLGMELIAHRGPDGQGTWVSNDGRVGLGHVRLSVIDIDHGIQPMLSQNNRYSMVFNGEIYNYLELREELGKEGFVTDSDTEVILQAYEKWGATAVTKLRGMFAIAIWDSKEQRLFVARDRFGIKPLYWAQTEKGFYFASETKALLPFLETRQTNKAALSDYFTFQFCLGDKTLMEGISQVLPAHCGYVDSGNSSPSLERYWEVQYDIDYEHTEKWFTERLRELMYDSIKVHLRADVEIGAYVSGGVDSSLMGAIAREFRPDGSFQAFNGRFLDDISFDESKYAQDLANENDMQLHIADISEQDFVDNLEKIIWHLDQPIAGPGSFPQYMVSKKVAENVKVVLGGQGGDEIFGGYARYLVAYFEQCIKGAIEGTLHDGNYLVTYDSIINNLETLRQYKPMIKEFWAEGVFEERDKRYWRLVNRANTFGGVITPEVLNKSSTFTEFSEVFWGKNVARESYFDSMTHFDFKTLLPALLQVEDRMSMAHGVESRVPLLDHPLVEFAATIPADIKFRDGELKRLLKKVFSDKLPNSITSRKDKMGFPVPLNMWLKNGGVARDFIGDLLSSRKAQTRGYLKEGFKVDDILQSQSVYGRNLWALLSLEIWHKQFIDRD